MRNWLLNSALALILAMAVVSGCCNRISKEKNAVAPGTDTLTKQDVPASGTPVNSSESNMKEGGDTAAFKGEIRHSGPDQRRIDSIKEEKTKRKK